jgi:hypothetical protein
MNQVGRFPAGQSSPGYYYQLVLDDDTTTLVRVP